MWTVLVLLSLAGHALAREQFIVGGDPVDIADFPWQGSYRTTTGFHTCGVVFVGGVYALSAAHCGGNSDYTMEFGTTVLGNGTIANVDTVVLHPAYGSGPGFLPFDFSVITATAEISGTNISPATINNDIANPGGVAWITGWGRTCEECAPPVGLMGAEIYVITDLECADVYGDSFQASSMICVWNGENGEQGACSGDSGGPMTIGNTVYGITSWITAECLPEYPSVYARVGAVHSWLCSETNDQGSGC